MDGRPPKSCSSDWLTRTLAGVSKKLKNIGVGSLLTMVSRILDSVRLTRGRVDLKREPVLLATAVGRVVGQFDERARGQRITISM